MDNRDQIEAIKEALDIVSVVNGYVPSLKRSGRNYFGLCPFHKEKTPSFSVNPDLKLFKCFGCGEGGDVIKFLSRIEGLEFPKALQLAADKAGIVLRNSWWRRIWISPMKFPAVSVSVSICISSAELLAYQPGRFRRKFPI